MLNFCRCNIEQQKHQLMYLSKGEEESQIAVNALLLQFLCGSDTCPGGGNLQTHNSGKLVSNRVA